MLLLVAVLGIVVTTNYSWSMPLEPPSDVALSLVSGAEEPLTLKVGEGMVMSVAFSPDGTHLATASFNRTVSAWDLASIRQTLVLREHTAVVRRVSFVTLRVNRPGLQVRINPC